MSLYRRGRGPSRAATLSVCGTVLLSVVVVGCTEETFLNATRPLSDDILINADGARASQGLNRGDLGVGFINETPYRVIGTYGGYDPQDQDTIVTFAQLGLSSALDVEPNSAGRLFAMSATRAFALGSRRLLDLIRDNSLDSEVTVVRTYLTNVTVDTYLASQDLLKEDIGFSGAPQGDDQAFVPTQGTAEPLTVLLGPDYRMDSILIFTFVEDPNAPGGFLIEFTTARDLGVDVVKLIQVGPAERALLLAPLGLDRLTFELLTALGNPSVDASTFTIGVGTDPAAVEVTFSNQSSQDLTIAFFGPETKVVGVIAGGQREFKLTPGLYEYIVAPTTTSAAILTNTQQFNAGTSASLTLLDT